jgi:hypothetical protein
LRYNFEWDPNKAKQNIHKHGISFERASSVFLDPNALSIFDEEHTNSEERWVTMGIDKSEVLLVVCHTFNQETKESVRIRIFSARKANKKEIKQY